MDSKSPITATIVERPMPAAWRRWAWDVRGIFWFGIVYAVMQIVWAGIAVLAELARFGVIRLQRVPRGSSADSVYSLNFSAWLSFPTTLLRLLLPVLMLIALLELRRFRRGARRLALLALGAMLVVGVVECVVGLGGLITRWSQWPLGVMPQQFVAVAQDTVRWYGPLLLIFATLRREDVKSGLGWATSVRSSACGSGL